jgi:hypothetical protein
MGTKTQAFDIFQTPLSSHYPLPLSEKVTKLKGVIAFWTYFLSPNFKYTQGQK